MLDGDTDSITVKNVLEQGSVKITAVYCPELDLRFNIKKPVKLEPGESAEITFSGEVPEESLKCVHFTVYYNADTKTPLNYQTRGFTVMNGEAAVGSGTQKVLQNGILDKTAHPFCILRKLGFFEIVSMFLTVTVCRLNNLFR